jgi:hypothetical protein
MNCPDVVCIVVNEDIELSVKIQTLDWFWSKPQSVTTQRVQSQRDPLSDRDEDVVCSPTAMPDTLLLHRIPSFLLS